MVQISLRVICLDMVRMIRILHQQELEKNRLLSISTRCEIYIQWVQSERHQEEAEWLQALY